MPQETVKISFKPSKLIIFLLIVVVVIGVIFFMKAKPNSNSQKTAKNDLITQEIVLPRETGVADSGFELNNAGITAFNTKAVFDTLEKIDGSRSLKIYFSEGANASVKIKDYLNDVAAGSFYRLSFWARTNAAKEKTLEVSISGKEGSQNLGDFSFTNATGVNYYEFNFQAENEAADLIFVSTDKNKTDVWIDNVLVEKINIDSTEQLDDIRPTIFGNTSKFNLDQSQTGEDADSDTFFAIVNRQMGQIFQPTQPLISGMAMKIQKKGTGGTGTYRLQIREYDEKLGVISDKAIAVRYIYTDYSASFLDQIKEKEAQMTEEFEQNESDIKEGRIPNDPTVDQYPPEYTQQQIDDSKAQKRKATFALTVAEMKENFNVPYELEIPIAAKLDINKKYWIGIDSTGVKTDKRNYLKVFYNSAAGASENEPGFISKEAGTWQEYYTLWFKTFYPKHAQIFGEDILSGATVSDFGDQLIYQYQFNVNDYSSLSGFPGKKIYDMDSGNYEKSDEGGNYTLSEDQYATYKFYTVYPAKKVILRNANYHQSLAMDFSTDGENWDEIYSENPAENAQALGPIVIKPQEKSTTFYLRMRPGGNDSLLYNLSLEAELER